VQRSLLIFISFSFFYAAHASAYDIRTNSQGIPLHWGDTLTAIPYYIDRRGCGDISDGSDIEAIQSAFQTWEHVASGKIEFQFAGLVERGEVNPGTGVVMWIKEEWPYDSRYVAMTRVHPRADGRILKVEVWLNGRDYRWSTNGEAGTLDVQNVATHEVGHFIGLGDVQSTGQTMFEYIVPGEKTKRYLTDDDVEGVRAAYPRVSQDGELTLQVYSLDYANRNIRPVEKSYPALKTEGFVGLCPLADPGLARPYTGIIRARGGAATLSAMGADGIIAREYTIQCPYGINPGRIRAISSLDSDGDGAPSDIAALVSTPSGLAVLLGAVPRAADERKSIVLTSLPVKGADDVLAFAPLGPDEGETGTIVALAEKRRNSDFHISLARAVREGENGQMINLTPLRSWQIPDCTSILGLALREGKTLNREIAVLLRNGRGGMEVAVYASPFAAAPRDGELLEPVHRLDAGPIASAGKPIAVSSILSDDPGDLRNLSVILTR
jgi:hypothetical protein